MAIQCPRCGQQYDVTLFEYQRTLRCDCGELIDLHTGHVLRAGGPNHVQPVTPATREYIESPHIALEYDQYFRANELFKFDTQALDQWFPEPQRLLDLGCGTGRHLAHFAQRGFPVTGVDLSDYMLEVARQTLRRRQARATLVNGDITDLDALGLGTFPAIICMFSTLGMIYGRDNRIRFLEQVRQHLTPDGRFAAHVHNRWFNLRYPDGREYLWRALWDWLRRRPEPFQKLVDGYRRIRGMSLYVYSARELRQDLTRAGLAIEQLIYLNRRRNGRLRGLFRGLRANGFLALARPA